MNKKILIVMPVYNSEKTLHLAIESILNQTYKKFYLIIVDDCSTDSSLEIAKKYTKDSRVRLYRNKENRGAYYSRNAGLYFGRKLRWDYFTTHDADDVSFSNRYEDLLKTINKEDVNAVQDIFVRVNLKTKKEGSGQLTMAHALFKKSVFEDIGYFEETRFGADWEYWQRLKNFNLLNNKTTVSHNEIVGRSFIGENNLTVKIPIGSQKRRMYIQITYRKLRKMIKENNFYRDIDTETMVTEPVK